MVIVPMGKFLLAFFGERWDFEGGEREADLLVHALWTNSLFSFLVFLSFSLCFRSYLFSFSSCSVFLFTLWDILYFSIFFTGHDKGLFIVPAVTSVLLFCPLTAFVWSGRACQLYKTLARQRWVHFVLLCAADSFCPSVRRGLSCHDVNLLSSHT